MLNYPERKLQGILETTSWIKEASLYCFMGFGLKLSIHGTTVPIPQYHSDLNEHSFELAGEEEKSWLIENEITLGNLKELSFKCEDLTSDELWVLSCFTYTYNINAGLTRNA